jgi:hypothetical protein
MKQIPILMKSLKMELKTKLTHKRQKQMERLLHKNQPKKAKKIQSNKKELNQVKVKESMKPLKKWVQELLEPFLDQTSSMQPKPETQPPLISLPEPQPQLPSSPRKKQRRISLPFSNKTKLLKSKQWQNNSPLNSRQLNNKLLLKVNKAKSQRLEPL